MPLSVSLLYATCRALDVTPQSTPAGQLTLTGPPDAIARVGPLVRAQHAAFVAFLADESARGHVRQCDGFRVVRVYDVARDRWHDIRRDDPRVGLEVCRAEPQRTAILEAFTRATCATLPTAA